MLKQELQVDIKIAEIFGLKASKKYTKLTQFEGQIRSNLFLCLVANNFHVCLNITC